ncbi:MAG: ApaG domain [Alphaproteobacteria bacterium]|nr:ApaG domain [Alphaproteobacteria bacterium]
MLEDADYIVSQADGIRISACPVLVDKLAPSNFIWGYYLCIENNSNERIQLVGKDWNITDDAGNSYNDSSAGFKGELPELEPGEYFEFTSETPLASANAVFYGSCKILSEGQSQIKEIRIPTFSLSVSGNQTIPTIH